MRNLNLNIKETEKDPVRVVENPNSKIKEAVFYAKIWRTATPVKAAIL